MKVVLLILLACLRCGNGAKASWFKGRFSVQFGDQIKNVSVGVNGFQMDTKWIEAPSEVEMAEDIILAFDPSWSRGMMVRCELKGQLTAKDIFRKDGRKWTFDIDDSYSAKRAAATMRGDGLIIMWHRGHQMYFRQYYIENGKIFQKTSLDVKIPNLVPDTSELILSCGDYGSFNTLRCSFLFKDQEKWDELLFSVQANSITATASTFEDVRWFFTDGEDVRLVTTHKGLELVTGMARDSSETQCTLPIHAQTPIGVTIDRAWIRVAYFDGIGGDIEYHRIDRHSYKDSHYLFSEKPSSAFGHWDGSPLVRPMLRSRDEVYLHTEDGAEIVSYHVADTKPHILAHSGKHYHRACLRHGSKFFYVNWKGAVVRVDNDEDEGEIITKSYRTRDLSDEVNWFTNEKSFTDVVENFDNGYVHSISYDPINYTLAFANTAMNRIGYCTGLCDDLYVVNMPNPLGVVAYNNSIYVSLEPNPGSQQIYELRPMSSRGPLWKHIIYDSQYNNLAEIPLYPQEPRLHSIAAIISDGRPVIYGARGEDQLQAIVGGSPPLSMNLSMFNIPETWSRNIGQIVALHSTEPDLPLDALVMRLGNHPHAALVVAVLEPGSKYPAHSLMFSCAHLGFDGIIFPQSLERSAVIPNHTHRRYRTFAHQPYKMHFFWINVSMLIIGTFSYCVHGIWRSDNRLLDILET